MNPRRSLATALLLLLSAAPAGAAPPEVEERVEVRGPAPASVGASVTRLEREELETLGHLSVSEAIELAAGLRLDGGASRAGTNAAAMRGGDPNQVLVLLDGVVLNDPTGPEGGAVNLAALSLDEIESIEIVRGPASARVGGRALAGLVHVRTRSAAKGSTGPGGRLGAQAGSFGLLQAGAAVEGRSRRGRGRLSVGRETESGRIPGDELRRSQAHGRWSQALGGSAELELAGRWSRRRALDHPEGSGGPLLGDGALRRSLREELSLSAGLALRLGAWRHEWLLALADQEEDADSPAIGFAVPASSGTTGYRRLDLGWSASRPFGPRTGLDLSLGLQDERARQRGTLDLGFPVPSDYRLERSALTGAVVLSGGGGALAWEAGLRVDDPDEGGARSSAQAGLTRSFREDRLRLSAFLSEGFQLPSTFALGAPPELGGNPDLEPERSRSFELGLEGRGADGRLSGSVRAWIARYRDLVDFDFEAFTHVNRGSVEGRGLELAGNWTAGRLALRGRLAWQRVRDRAEDSDLARRPRWHGRLDLSRRVGEALNLALDLRGRSSFLDEQVPVDGPRRVSGGLALGAALAWTPREGLELRARLDDLFDSAPDPRLGWPAPGRSLRVSLTQSW